MSATHLPSDCAPSDCAPSDCAPSDCAPSYDAGEPLVEARFTVTAEAFPGLLSRVLEPFAKRGLIPDTLRAARDGAVMRAEVALHAMPLGMVHLVAGNLGQIVGVRRVEAMEGRVVRLAA